MEFWVKVSRQKGDNNAEKLIRAFFSDFTPESTIVVSEEEVSITKVFKDVPKQFFDVLCTCGVKEFKYQPEPLEEEEGAEDQPNLSENRTTNNNPLFDEFWKNSNSYEEFKKSLIKWIGFGAKQKFFERLIEAAEEVQEICWKTIEQKLSEKGESCTPYDKVYCSKKIATKFANSKERVTILSLIKNIVEYKKYCFNHDETAEEQKPQRTKMQCMPKGALPLESALKSIDKKQPIEERIKYVLTAMGLQKFSDTEQHNILAIASAGVKSKIMDMSTILENANIYYEPMKARIAFAKLINDFARQYDSEKRVKVLDFLEELKNVIV